VVKSKCDPKFWCFYDLALFSPAENIIQELNVSEFADRFFREQELFQRAYIDQRFALKNVKKSV